MTSPDPSLLLKLLERDVRGGLYADVMHHITHCATYIEHSQGRVGQDDRLRLMAYQQAVAKLTSRLLNCAGIMNLAKEFIGGDLALRHVRMKLAGIEIKSEKWWDATTIPDELEELCVIAQGLIGRVQITQQRLTRAVEAREAA